MPKCFHNRTSDGIIGHTDTNCFFSVRENFGNGLACFKDKSVRARKRVSHHLEYRVAQLLAVFGQITEVMAHQRKICLVEFYLFDECQFL